MIDEFGREIYLRIWGLIRKVFGNGWTWFIKKIRWGNFKVVKFGLLFFGGLKKGKVKYLEYQFRAYWVWRYGYWWWFGWDDSVKRWIKSLKNYMGRRK